MSALHYHKDKYGNSLKGRSGYCLRDDKGEVFELFGTGIVLSYPYDIVELWTKDNKRVFRRESELTLVKGFWERLFS